VGRHHLCVPVDLDSDLAKILANFIGYVSHCLVVWCGSLLCTLDSVESAKYMEKKTSQLEFSHHEHHQWGTEGIRALRRLRDNSSYSFVQIKPKRHLLTLSSASLLKSSTDAVKTNCQWKKEISQKCHCQLVRTCSFFIHQVLLLICWFFAPHSF